jgi:hypothetical protein
MTRSLGNVGHDADYEASAFFDDDAIDALAMSDDRPSWLMVLVRWWYKGTDRYQGVLDDARDGERSW